jgi:hypothetical protein
MLEGEKPVEATDRLRGEALKYFTVPVSPRINSAILEGLALKPENRIQNVQELLANLMPEKYTYNSDDMTVPVDDDNEVDIPIPDYNKPIFKDPELDNKPILKKPVDHKDILTVEDNFENSQNTMIRHEDIGTFFKNIEEEDDDIPLYYPTKKRKFIIYLITLMCSSLIFIVGIVTLITQDFLAGINGGIILLIVEVIILTLLIIKNQFSNKGTILKNTEDEDYIPPYYPAEKRKFIISLIAFISIIGGIILFVSFG